MFDYKNEAEIRRYQQMLRIEAGRRVLDQINGKTRQIRQDGYINLLNKYGTVQDNSTAYHWEPETPVTDSELTELYQDGSLFAKIIDAPADEAVKNGVDLGVTDEKAREYIEDTLAWLEWDENISTALKWSRLYGGAIAVMMIDDGGGLDEPLDLGNIRGIDEIRVYDRSIAIPDYSSIYKLDPSSSLSSRTGSNRFRHRFLEPEFYDVASIYGSFRVHESRCLVFRNGKVPERSSLTQYRHWGIPEYIRIRKELREAVTSVSYSVKMLEKSVQAIYGMKNLQELLTTDEGEDMVLRRLRVIDMARNFLNSIAIDSDGESYDFKSMTLSGVKDIVETTFATISAVSNVPQTVLFGRSPAGENATGDGDLENWYSYVQRIWKVDVKSNLKYLVDIIIKSGMAQGYITEDPKPKIEMNPLWSLSETEQATVDQTKANTEQVKATTLQTYLGELRLELNEKTNIFPLRHGLDFLGFHTYITESGQVVRKLRHSSVKKMNAKMRKWEKDYPKGEVTKEKILDSWTAWDAHAAHGNTYTLRVKVAARVSKIVGIPLKCHAPIRLSKKQKAMLEYKKRRKASQNAALPAAPEHHGADVPW